MIAVIILIGTFVILALGAFWLGIRDHWRAAYTVLGIGIVAIIIEMIVLPTPANNETRRRHEVEEQIKECISEGNLPVFDLERPEFFGCVKP